MQCTTRCTVLLSIDTLIYTEQFELSEDREYDVDKNALKCHRKHEARATGVKAKITPGPFKALLDKQANATVAVYY